MQDGSNISEIVETYDITKFTVSHAHRKYSMNHQSCLARIVCSKWEATLAQTTFTFNARCSRYIFWRSVQRFFFLVSKWYGRRPIKVPILTLRNHVKLFTWACDVFNMRKSKVSQFHLFGIDCSVLVGTDPMKTCKQFVKKAPCRLVVVL